MNLDRALQADMERQLVLRADSGPNSDPPVAERTRPRASELASGCARKCFYTLTGAPKEPRSPASASATTLGQAIEADVIGDLKAAVPGEWREQVKLGAEWVTGTADAVLYEGGQECAECNGAGEYAVMVDPTPHTPTGSDWTAEADTYGCHACKRAGRVGGNAVLVADSKSANTASWEIKERQGSCGDDIEAQLQIYMHLSGAPEAVAVFRKTGGNARDMAKGVYLPIRFPYRPEVVERMRALAEQAMEGKRQNVAPEPGFKRGHWLCKDYCDYRAICPSGGA